MAAVWDQDNFEAEVLGSPIPVLVDFYAEWCGPCKMLAPVIEELAADYEGKVKVGKVNIDESLALADRYGVQSVPTLILFRNGQAVKRVTGAMPKARLEAELSL